MLRLVFSGLGGSTRACACSLWHASLLVDLSDDGVEHLLQILLFGLILLDFGIVVGGDPALHFLNLILEGFLLLRTDLALEVGVVERVLDVGAEALQGVPGLDLAAHLVVLVLELL